MRTNRSSYSWFGHYRMDKRVSLDDLRRYRTYKPRSLHISITRNEALAVCVLSTSITSLSFGDSFNQPLTPGVLPSSLTSLTFGATFNELLCVLPTALTTLVFGRDFNRRLRCSMPGPSKKKNDIIFCNVLPSTLSTLVFNPSIEVRKAVADNPRTPYRALMMLVFDVCPEVRFQVAENRNVPDWVLQVLIEDESPYVRWCALNTLNEKMR